MDKLTFTNSKLRIYMGKLIVAFFVLLFTTLEDPIVPRVWEFGQLVCKVTAASFNLQFYTSKLTFVKFNLRIHTGKLPFANFNHQSYM